MSWAFFGLFAGFGAAQSLQSSLNAALGFINLACLYFAFVIAGLASPPIVNHVVASCGWHAMCIAAACTYMLMIASNLDTGPSQYFVQPIANALLGAGGAFLWTSQNFYFGQCASLAGRAASAEGTSVTDAINRMATRFNSSFFGLFQFANTTGCLVSSFLMLAFSKVAWMRTLLFFVLGAAALCGTMIFLLLPSIDHRQDSQEASPSLTAAFRVLADPKITLMLPWIITQGMTFAFINADFTADVVSPLLGPDYVGLIMSAFYGCDTLFTLLWGELMTKRGYVFTRRVVFTLTTCFWTAFFLLKVFWKHEPNYEKDGDDWKHIAGTTVSWLDAGLPVVLAFLAAGGDGFWNPGPPAMLQSFFAESNLLAAMAAYKAPQSLGFAIQFSLGAALNAYPTTRAAILLGCCAVSFASLTVLDRCKQPLDPRASDMLIDPSDAD